MRINAGTHRGRAISAPDGKDTRPTSDRTREAIFNILEHGLDGRAHFKDATVIDVFAGSGALGIEALSRGARHAIFVEKARSAIAAIEKNLRTFGLDDAADVLKMDAARLPACSQTPAGLALLDPPYHQDLCPPTLTTLVAKGWLAKDCVVVCEIAANETLALPDGFTMLDERTWGAAKAVFCQWQDEGA